MDVLARLRQFQNERGWSEYRMAKNCNLSESTIANIYRRGAMPSIPTLQAICDGYGITMSQFFAENEMIEITPAVKELFDLWVSLTPKQKESVLQICRAMREE